METKKRMGFLSLRDKTETKQLNNSWSLTDSINAGLTYGAYRPLSKCPEVIMCVDKIADLVSNMTIHLMENTDSGDKRIKNGLSDKIDLEPCYGMTRKHWVKQIVRTLLLEGDGNAVVIPTYSTEENKNYIENLIPVPAKDVSFKLGPTFLDGYRIRIGNREFLPENLIHFVLNPHPQKLWIGQGYRIPLENIIDTLDAAQGVKENYMKSRYMPSIIIKVDADVEEFESMNGRSNMLDEFIRSESAGQPWIIPTDLFEVQQVTPLSLKDIAVTDTVAQDKKTIAALMGVPSFFLGEGEFNQQEYNNFIKDKILSISKVLEQTLTKSLIYGDNWYFKFNIQSLYAHDLGTLKDIGADLYSRGVMTGNEVRDLLGFSPLPGLDELIILENYIPQQAIGDQKKLDTKKESNE